MILAQNAGLLS